MGANDVTDSSSAQLSLVDAERPLTAATTLSADASVFVPGEPPRRVLAAKTSRERSPRRNSSPPSSSLACPTTAVPADLHEFAVGQAMVLSGLVARPELSGKCVTVRSFDGASGRYAVSIDSSGETVRVLPKNLKKSIFVAGSGPR